MLKYAALFAGPLLFALICMLPLPDGLSAAGMHVLGLTLWMAIWWMTEPIPMAATSLLPLIVLPLSGVSDFRSTSSGYSNEIIFLFLGSFILGKAIEKWNLHRRLALFTLSKIGMNPSLLVLGFMGVTAFISMWISNTATAAMMLPIGMAVAGHVPEAIRKHFGKALMLGIAYAASLGGMGTPIGTPTNAIFIGHYEKTYQHHVSFGEWMPYGVPVALALTFLTWVWLSKVTYKLPGKMAGGDRSILTSQYSELGKMAPEEWLTISVFGAVALMWMSGAWLTKLLPGLNDSMIALFGALLMFLLPAPSHPKGHLLTWDDAERIPWGILLLFGGGLSLADSFKSSGFDVWLGLKLAGLNALPAVLIVLIILGMIVLLSEIASNVATVAMALPILTALAGTLGLAPYGLLFGATLAASCGFMLPVATAPNAIAFSSGYLSTKDMARAGLFLDIVSVGLITLLVFIL